MISVIIPTRNRAQLLQVVLESLAGQTLSSDLFEVLVIDNGSSDNTSEVARRAQAFLTNTRYFHEPEPGLHAGRHRGLFEARSDVLVFADDDIRAEASWLEAIAENFADPSVSMLGGNNYPDFQGHVPGWLNRLWNRQATEEKKLGELSVLSLPEGRRPINPKLVWGCNFSIRKQVVLDARGFHPDSMPKELIHLRGDGETHISRYVQEHGLLCMFDSRASVYHAVTPARMTFDYFHQRAFNQGVSDSYSQLRHTAGKTLSPGNFSSAKDRLFGVVRRIARWARENDTELRKLSGLYRQGHAAGFAFHQRAYRDDPHVRAWVHRQDYFQAMTPGSGECDAEPLS